MIFLETTLISNQSSTVTDASACLTGRAAKLWSLGEDLEATEHMDDRAEDNLTVSVVKTIKGVYMLSARIRCILCFDGIIRQAVSVPFSVTFFLLPSQIIFFLECTDSSRLCSNLLLPPRPVMAEARIWVL